MSAKPIILSLLSFLLCSCANQRTPSKDRLEAVSAIKLPATFYVLKDEFQDMGQDYAIYYDLKFANPSIIKLIEHIKSSRLYHADGSSAMYSDSVMYRKPNDFSIWYTMANGYEFMGKDGDVLYEIIVDVKASTLRYHEYVL